MASQRKYALFALVSLSICALALYIHRHRQGKTGYIDNLVIGVSGVFQNGGSDIVQHFRDGVNHYFFLVETSKNNQQLLKENAYLQTKLAALSEVALQNDRFKELLAFKQEVDQPLLSAHVIAHDVSSDFFGVRVDRGSQDGVEVGQGVISSAGLVGRVLRVTETYADVLTLVDPTSNIDVVIQRSRARGVISGQSIRTTKLKYMDRLEDVVVGDTVVASNFGNIFPEGLLVGYVTAVIPNPSGVTQVVTVRSAVDINRLEEVFIVFPPKHGQKLS